MISVIIPAHNEEAVLPRALAALTGGAQPGEMEVVVVCNGCTDGSAQAARAFGAPVRVIETEVASKIHALNLGDREARGFPRFYVDADIVMAREALLEGARAITAGGALAAAPRLRADLSKSSWLVRSFYRAWLSLPYFDEGMIGSGVFGLSEAARARFDEFPDIIADDGFARLVVAPHERKTVRSCSFTITPPTTIAGVVKIKTRARAGAMQLQREFPEMIRNEGRGRGGSALRMLFRPWNWPDYLVYGVVTLVALRKGRRKLAAGRQKEWERDDTSRRAPSAPGGGGRAS